MSTILNTNHSEPASEEQRRWLLRGATLVIVASLAAIIWAMPVKEFANVLRDWAEGTGAWAGVVFAVIFVLMTVFSVPVWPMPFVAGAILGTVVGWLTMSLSCALGAAVNFGIARWAGQGRFREYLERSPRMRALEKTVSSEGWKVVAAVRLSHFLTFGMQNYAFGLTRIRFWPYLLATWLVTLPGIFLQSYLGNLGFTSMESWQSDAATEWQVWSLRIGGLVAIAAAVGYLGHFMRRAYRDAVEQQLRHELEEQSVLTGAVQSAWPTILMCGAAVLLAVLAVWSVSERKAIQRYADEALTYRRENRPEGRFAPKRVAGRLAVTQEAVQ